MGDLFRKDGSLDESKAADMNRVQLDAALAGLVAEHDQAITARRAGEPNDLKAISRRLSALRAHVRLADGRSAQPTIAEGGN